MIFSGQLFISIFHEYIFNDPDRINIQRLSNIQRFFPLLYKIFAKNSGQLNEKW